MRRVCADRSAAQDPVIDFDPSEEQQLIVDTVRQFARNEVRPRARECDEAAKLPAELLHEAHALGLVANGIDERFGGGGARSAVTGALVAEELAWGDLSIAAAILSPSLESVPVSDLASDAQKQRWLPGLVGERFRPGALALVESHYGADPLVPRTRARRDGAGYVLDGEKCLVPWLEGGESVLVSATGDTGPQLFRVSRQAMGLRAAPARYMGIQALPTVELTLASVRVAGDDALPAARDGVASVVQRGRVAQGAMAIGVARAAYEVARDYAKERQAFGAPIATKQAIAFKLADMAIEIDAARLLLWEAAWHLDSGRDAARAVFLAYRQAQRVALEVSDAAVQVLGGHGYTREYLPELCLRNARGFACFEGLSLV
ncbi:MAG TPA: acyl-CoA dehydrogenase family protein [Myxococcota bacterium]|nr:acyl-CoA dehydrogenase family protein [Myxococcota bacterium]